jgi:hypothetical protein
MHVDDFITKWRDSGGQERANYQTFLNELTVLLGVEAPLPADDAGLNDHYRFDRYYNRDLIGAKSGYIDLWR